MVSYKFIPDINGAQTTAMINMGTVPALVHTGEVEEFYSYETENWTLHVVCPDAGGSTNMFFNTDKALDSGQKYKRYQKEAQQIAAHYITQCDRREWSKNAMYPAFHLNLFSGIWGNPSFESGPSSQIQERGINPSGPSAAVGIHLQDRDCRGHPLGRSFGGRGYINPLILCKMEHVKAESRTNKRELGIGTPYNGETYLCPEAMRVWKIDDFRSLGGLIWRKSDYKCWICGTFLKRGPPSATYTTLSSSAMLYYCIMCFIYHFFQSRWPTLQSHLSARIIYFIESQKPAASTKLTIFHGIQLETISEYCFI